MNFLAHPLPKKKKKKKNFIFKTGELYDMWIISQ